MNNDTTKNLKYLTELRDRTSDILEGKSGRIMKEGKELLAEWNPEYSGEESEAFNYATRRKTTQDLTTMFYDLERQIG